MRFHRPLPLASRPTVSVVIPCYNYGRFLPEAVAGALDQEGVDVEVIVVDDASTDDSADVARALSAADPRVQVLLHERNAGHIQTYNDGLARATGDYVTLVSADDVLPRNALSRAAALMEHHPEVGLVYGYARSFVDAPTSSVSRVRSWSVYPGRQWLRLAAGRGRCFVVSPEAVMRRETLQRVGGYDARLPHSADFDLWLRSAARSDVGRVNGPVQAHYRVHEHNMHLTAYAGWLTDLEERRKTFAITFGEHLADLGETPRLDAAARRALAREAVRRSLSAIRDGEPSARAYLQFAEDVDGEVRSTLPWRLAAGLVDRHGSVPGAATWRYAARVDHHVRWRRERRYGT